MLGSFSSLKFVYLVQSMNNVIRNVLHFQFVLNYISEMQRVFFPVRHKGLQGTKFCQTHHISARPTWPIFSIKNQMRSMLLNKHSFWFWPTNKFYQPWHISWTYQLCLIDLLPEERISKTKNMMEIRRIVWGQMDMVRKHCHWVEVLVPKVRKSAGTAKLLLLQMITILLTKYSARTVSELFFGGPKQTKILPAIRSCTATTFAGPA